jgi:hypothetical protein
MAIGPGFRAFWADDVSAIEAVVSALAFFAITAIATNHQELRSDDESS